MSVIRDPLPFRAEYAPDRKISCKSTACMKKIEKGTLRFCRRKESSNFDGKDPLWFHEECFFRNDKLIPKSIGEISNFDNLKFKDQKSIKVRINGGPTTGTLLSYFRIEKPNGTRERNLEEDEMEIDAVVPSSEEEQTSEPPKKKFKMDNAKLLMEQNKRMWFYREALQKMTRKERENLFDTNNQYLLAGHEDRLNILADGMAFGALERCSRCKWGQLIVNTGNYRCISRTRSTGERCNELFEDPPRKLFLVTEDLRKKYEFLSEYECEIERRVFMTTADDLNKSYKPNTPARAKVVAGTSTAIAERDSSSSKVMLEIRDDTAVDPQSKKRWVSHVFRDTQGNIYSAYFTRIDLFMGKNSYYILQVLEPNPNHREECYWLFKSWGRTGTSRGSAIHDQYLTSREAINAFEDGFFKISGNRWADRHNFVKKASKYSFVCVSYEASISVEDLCNLDKTVQHLMKFLFNDNSITELLMRWELDLERMPLGKLSSHMIVKGFESLKNLEIYVIKYGEGMTDQIIRHYTNEFFTNIPHTFGNDNPPLLNTKDIIQNKRDLLNDLMYIDMDYLSSNLRKSHERVKTMDSLYKQLKTNIQPVKNTDSDPELEAFRLYFKNTQAHETFKLNLIRLFKVDRNGEDERFAPFKSFHRQLLWHGTKTYRVNRILSQGFVLPIESPQWGGMFGNGIYFADRVSKSAQYCRPNPDTKIETGILLLCEVALGKMYELYEAEFIASVQNLPVGTNSVKAVGEIEPDPKETNVLESGIEVPLGRSIPRIDTVPSKPPKKPRLKYNEYVIYDERQIKIKYLAWVEFKYPESRP